MNESKFGTKVSRQVRKILDKNQFSLERMVGGNEAIIKIFDDNEIDL